jgi:hypothetical protein
MNKDLKDSVELNCELTKKNFQTFTQFQSNTSYKEMNWQMTNNENQSVTIKELENTLVEYKWQAPSEDEINSELYKCDGQIIHHRLLKVFNTIIKTGQVP